MRKKLKNSHIRKLYVGKFLLGYLIISVNAISFFLNGNCCCQNVGNAEKNSRNNDKNI